MVISPTIEVWIFCLSIEVSIFCLSIDVVLPLLPRWWFLVKFQNVWARHQACQRDDLNLRGLETIVHKHYITLHYTISPINVTYIKFYATSISSSTLPQSKRKMQQENKRMQVNQDMAVRMRTKITRISPSRRLTVPASLRPSSVYFCFCACDLTDVAKDCARFQWQSDFNLEMTHYLE